MKYMGHIQILEFFDIFKLNQYTTLNEKMTIYLNIADHDSIQHVNLDT